MLSMAEKGYEIISQFLLNQVLIKRFDSIKWEKVINDPPDYWLTIEYGRKYAVEVTSSKFCREISDYKGIAERTFVKSVYKFAKDIESEAIKKNLLRGTYTLDFKKPIPDRGYRKYMKKIRAFIFNYLKETFDLTKTEPFSFYIDEVEIFDISKSNDDRNAFYALPGARSAFINSPNNDELIVGMLQYAINDKMDKLKSIKEPKILIYYDTYYLSTEDNYLRCTTRLDNVGFFDSIFVILDGENIINIQSNLLLN